MTGVSVLYGDSALLCRCITNCCCELDPNTLEQTHYEAPRAYRAIPSELHEVKMGADGWACCRLATPAFAFAFCLSCSRVTCFGDHLAGAELA